MSDLSRMGRFLIVAGLLIAGFGVLLTYTNSLSWIGNLPGDLYIEGENYRVYFPLATCLVLSVLLSLVIYFVNVLAG